MKILTQVAIIFAICLLGECAAMALPFPFPGSVASMVLVFILLCTKLLKVRHIQDVAGFLTQNMALFFVPICVKILQYVDVLYENFLAISVISIVSTVLVFGSTVCTVKCASAWQMRKKQVSNHE